MVKRKRNTQIYALRAKHVKSLSEGFKSHKAALTLKSEDMTRMTPREFLKLVREVFGGSIELDPCGGPGSFVKATTEWFGEVVDAGKDPKTKEKITIIYDHHTVNGRKKAGGVDGLLQSWRGYGSVFANPPYGGQLRKWVEKCVAEFGSIHKARQSRGQAKDELILLTAARPGTKWFQDLIIENATAFTYLDHRLTFEGCTGPAGFDNLVTYFGRSPAKFIKVFKHEGWTLNQVTGQQYRKGVEI